MKGLENVVAAETALCHIDGEKGELVIRGEYIEDLAKGNSFEEAVFFLWKGRFPTGEELNNFSNQMYQAMNLDPEYCAYLDGIPTDLDAVSHLMAAFSGLDKGNYSWPPSMDQASHLLGLLPAVLGRRQSRLEGRMPRVPDSTLGFAGNYLYLVLGDKPEPAAIRALETYFILTMEHGLNASTFTARVIASTRSDLVSTIVGAMGALKGPLHGGAPMEVIEMLEHIGEKENIVPWLEEKLQKGQRIMGFGHRVYRARDPRANVLREVSKPLAKDGGWFALALEVEEEAERLLAKYKPKRKLNTNVEFYAAALFKALQLPKSIYTATFATSRTVGWCAHALEQAEANRIIRPRAMYIGKNPGN